MKTLGMIGGTSWHSTIVYYRLINELVGKEIGTQGNPPLILHSINIELMRSQNWEKINKTYLEVANKIEQAGAEALIICANTPHKVYDFVQPKIDIPILHIADATGIEASKRGVSRLGLLGNKPTMTKGFIQTHLSLNYSIDTIIPDEEHLDVAHHYVSKELTQGKFTSEAKDFFIKQIQLLKRKGAEGIVLGCTELPILISKNDFDIPMFATTDLHAKMAVEFILGHLHDHQL
ncbi:aspartate/glutamate racemase family protein [Sungkyunkwania multivorans]|uniref:Aspartate/glutamate racemase family protein n=1 Tax=Sungkyunkwania multivorans TaxID=1173618 RepID=A0ABW3CYS2_9FLAO